MGKIIKFDPNRRRQGRRSWTRPEDYGAPSAPKPRRQPASRAGIQWPGTSNAPRRTRLLARTAVAGVIALGVLTSLYGLT